MMIKRILDMYAHAWSRRPENRIEPEEPAPAVVRAPARPGARKSKKKAKKR